MLQQYCTEKGTGKNLIADTQYKSQAQKPNIAVNCPAIPSELLESELFGHEKGPYRCPRKKRWKVPSSKLRSTFLDEIGDMSPCFKQKFWHQSGEIERVGGAETIKIDVRIISATNQP